MAPFNLDLASLSLSPLPGHGNAALYGSLRPIGEDPLRVWPHEYDSTTSNELWATCLDWSQFGPGKYNVHEDCGWEPYAFNYCFNALFDKIPSGVCRQDHSILTYDVKGWQDYNRKMRNFYAGFKYITHYPTQHSVLPQLLGLKQGVFIEQVVPTIFALAHHVSFLDWNLRLWPWNHCEMFPERVLTTFDCWPQEVAQPKNRWLHLLLKSGKYKVDCVKGELGIMLGPGWPIHYSGPHLGVRNDSRIWNEGNRRFKFYPWEYALGDKAYVGCPEFLCEIKKPKGGSLSEEDKYYNKTLQHYRGRVEHLIGDLQKPRKALNSKWKGSFELLAAIMKLSVHMLGLQERMKGPRYDVFGPWPVCPDSVVQLYQ